MTIKGKNIAAIALADIVMTPIINLFTCGVCGLVLAIPLMLAWNLAVPHLLGLPTINLIHSFALILAIGLVVTTCRLAGSIGFGKN